MLLAGVGEGVEGLVVGDGGGGVDGGGEAVGRVLGLDGGGDGGLGGLGEVYVGEGVVAW